VALEWTTKINAIVNAPIEVRPFVDQPGT
jgi:hypothetical protein